MKIRRKEFLKWLTEDIEGYIEYGEEQTPDDITGRVEQLLEGVVE